MDPTIAIAAAIAFAALLAWDGFRRSLSNGASDVDARIAELEARIARAHADVPGLVQAAQEDVRKEITNLTNHVTARESVHKKALDNVVEEMRALVKSHDEKTSAAIAGMGRTPRRAGR